MTSTDSLSVWSVVGAEPTALDFTKQAAICLNVLGGRYECRDLKDALHCDVYYGRVRSCPLFYLPMNYLIISDLQIPFEHERALDHCKRLKRWYKIPDENVYNVGDELDQYFGSLYKKDCNADFSAASEIKSSLKKLRHWYRAFPQMKLCISNHGTRWERKAFEAEIPSQLLRAYRDVIEAPDGWQWKKRWVVKDKYPFHVEHGDDWGGRYPHVNAALHNGASTAMGHHHSLAGIEHMVTAGHEAGIWGMVTGCMIDVDQFAFEYARRAKLKPCLMCGVVLDSGKKPVLEPL